MKMLIQVKRNTSQQMTSSLYHPSGLCAGVPQTPYQIEHVDHQLALGLAAAV